MGAFTTGTLKLAARGTDARLDVAILGTRDTKVLDGFTGILLSPQQKSLFTLGGTEGQLVKSDSLTTGGKDASPSSLGEFEGSDGHLGDDGETLIIGNGSHYDGDGVILASLKILADGGDGEGGTVGLAHAETLEDDLVKGRAGTASEETVQLYQQSEVNIIASGGSALTLFDVMTIDIDTLK